MKNLKIAIIGIYYGTFPDWMPYWLKSCEDNETIDFLLVTDIKNIDVPKNVHIIDISMSELKKIAEKKLEMDISLEKPYKLCAFKPVYGKILSDYIKNYDYWGHCDFDMIFGDIRYYIDKYDLNQYDKFLPLGHLALYRNTEKVNNYYKLPGSKCGDYEYVFRSKENIGFDETYGIYSIYKYNKLPMFSKRIFAEIKTYHERFRVKFREINYYNQVFYYENGKVYRAYKKKGKIYIQEYIYIHFRRKLNADKNMKFSNLSCFYITNKGFYNKEKGIPSLEDIKKYNYNPGYLKEIKETIKFCIKKLNK